MATVDIFSPNIRKTKTLSEVIRESRRRRTVSPSELLDSARYADIGARVARMREYMTRTIPRVEDTSTTTSYFYNTAPEPSIITEQEMEEMRHDLENMELDLSYEEDESDEEVW